MFGRITRFEADEKGLVSLDVQWSVRDGDREQVIAPTRSTFQAQARPGDYDSIVAAMDNLIAEFAVAIAEAISGLE